MVTDSHRLYFYKITECNSYHFLYAIQRKLSMHMADYVLAKNIQNSLRVHGRTVYNYLKQPKAI